MNITNCDIVPNPSGCQHAELRGQLDGENVRVPIQDRSAFLSGPPSGDITGYQGNVAPEAALVFVARVRSYIKENFQPGTSLAVIRQGLQLQSFKI